MIFSIILFLASSLGSTSAVVVSFWYTESEQISHYNNFIFYLFVWSPSLLSQQSPSLFITPHHCLTPPPALIRRWLPVLVQPGRQACTFCITRYYRYCIQLQHFTVVSNNQCSFHGGQASMLPQYYKICVKFGSRLLQGCFKDTWIMLQCYFNDALDRVKMGLAETDKFSNLDILTDTDIFKSTHQRPIQPIFGL